jgi:hypothetical protein
MKMEVDPVSDMFIPSIPQTISNIVWECNMFCVSVLPDLLQFPSCHHGVTFEKNILFLKVRNEVQLCREVVIYILYALMLNNMGLASQSLFVKLSLLL